MLLQATSLEKNLALLSPKAIGVSRLSSGKPGGKINPVNPV
jgi:hypothetical protein